MKIEPEKGYLQRLPIIRKEIINPGTRREAEVTIVDGRVIRRRYRRSWIRRLLR